MLVCANGEEIKVGSILTTDHIIFFEVVEVRGIEALLKSPSGFIM